jgi:ribosomal protein L19E
MGKGSKKGVTKSRNPLTAKVTKVLRKDRKELKYNILTLRTLQQLSALCG